MFLPNGLYKGKQTNKQFLPLCLFPYKFPLPAVGDCGMSCYSVFFISTEIFYMSSVVQIMKYYYYHWAWVYIPANAWTGKINTCPWFASCNIKISVICFTSLLWMWTRTVKFFAHTKALCKFMCSIVFRLLFLFPAYLHLIWILPKINSGHHSSLQQILDPKASS